MERGVDCVGRKGREDGDGWRGQGSKSVFGECMGDGD